jgi:hypothetical protein
MRQVWAWLQTPNLIWWMYGGGVAFLLLIGLVKQVIVKKKRRPRLALVRDDGARWPTRNRRVS